MLIEFIGAAHEVTGSCHFITWNDKHFLVDCGMEQGPDIYENQEIPVNVADIDYVLVTHAHIDHSGLLPLLYQKGFKGEIFCTTATAQLCNIMLKDSAHIQEFEAEWKNRKARRAGEPEVVPMYTMQDALGALQLFIPCEYNHKIKVTDGMEIRFLDAGHLLGSSIIEVWLTEDGEETKIVFSGDLGTGNRPLIRDPQLVDEADYLLIESTYGTRNHDAPPDYALELAKVLERTFTRGGNVVIPAFSVGRTQEMLYHLRRVKEEHMICANADFDVYVDSPLAVEATNIFNLNVAGCYSDYAKELMEKGINPIQFPGLKTSISSDDSRRINFINKPIVIISASGMCEAGRIRHHLKHNLWRPESTVVFVGYQVPGTLGNKLLNGETKVKLFGEAIDVRAEIVNLPGISGHADMDGLTNWIGGMKKLPKKIFVVHGEDATTDEFAAHLTKKFGVETYAPYSGDIYDLTENVLVENGTRKLAVKKKKGSQAASDVFRRLLNAGQRLMAVIHRNEGGANKDLAKFADQINNLCDKWDR